MAVRVGTSRTPRCANSIILDATSRVFGSSVNLSFSVWQTVSSASDICRISSGSKTLKESGSSFCSRASDCRAACCQRLRDAAYPELKRLKNDSVSFRSMKVQKFHYWCIEFFSHFRSPALLSHGQPSALKRSKSAFLLVGHGPLISALPTPTPQFYEQSIDSRVRPFGDGHDRSLNRRSSAGKMRFRSRLQSAHA